jgi:hypothetical protein
VQLDYLKNNKHHVEELKQQIKHQNRDEQISTIIDMSEQLAGSRLNEMKLKRQLQMKTAKEKYLQKQAQQLQKHAKDLEEKYAGEQHRYLQA